MKIYRLDFDVNNYKSIQLCENVNSDFYQMFDGTSLADRWETMRVKYYEEDRDLKDGDAPGFNIPVFREKALKHIMPLIEDDVEVLSLQLNGEILYGINVIKIIDAVDYELSKYRTYRDGKRIMAFKKYVFIDEKLKNINIFKIIDLPRGDIFVSDFFCKTVIDNKLEGFRLELVYDSNNRE